MADRIPHELQSNWYSLFVYPMRLMTRRAALHVDIGIRTHFTRHDHQSGGCNTAFLQATFELASRRRNSSRMASGNLV